MKNKVKASFQPFNGILEKKIRDNYDRVVGIEAIWWGFGINFIVIFL